MVVTDIVLVSVEFRQLRRCNGRDLAKWMIVPFCFAGMLTSSIYAFSETTMTTVLVFKNTLPLFALLAEKLIFGVPQRVTISMLLSIGTVTVGVVIYGRWDIS